MAYLPRTPQMPVVLAQAGAQETWASIQRAIAQPTQEGYSALVDFVEDPSLADLDEAELAGAYRKSYPQEYRHPAVIVVDRVALDRPEHPVLVINLDGEDPTPPFRALPSAIQAIENNLSLANMDFVDFAGAVDPDGIFRGFR